jgi:hypothetical protein
VCYSVANDTNPCVNHALTNSTWFEVKELKPYQFVKFAIKAATIAGFGPASLGYQWTLETGKQFNSHFQ